MGAFRAYMMQLDTLKFQYTVVKVLDGNGYSTKYNYKVYKAYILYF